MTKEEYEGWPKEKRPRPKMAKYGGMSVKEIYDALDHRERLIDAYKEKQDECARLHAVIDKSIEHMLETAMHYDNVAQVAENPADKIEFLCRSAGLQEAVRHMRMIFNGIDKEKD